LARAHLRRRPGGDGLRQRPLDVHRRLPRAPADAQPLLALRLPLHRLPVLRLPGHDGQRVRAQELHVRGQHPTQRPQSLLLHVRHRARERVPHRRHGRAGQLRLQEGRDGQVGRYPPRHRRRLSVARLAGAVPQALV
ncbi:hypothetical protein LTR28_005632, partial [Elasticomyces elasticus]